MMELNLKFDFLFWNNILSEYFNSKKITVITNDEKSKIYSVT